MPEDPVPNQLYQAYDQTGPTHEQMQSEREQRALEREHQRAAHRSGGDAGGGEIAALRARVAALESLIRKLRGADGITVKLPVISGAGLGKGQDQTQPTLTVRVSQEGIPYDLDIVVISSRIATL